MAHDRWIGQVLGGRYQIEQLLGQGGMSAVYKARDPNLQRTVAIKLIHPHLSDNEEFVRRFESEATSIARLRHPNIVQVYDFNHEGDLYFMVLEFVAGETLQSRIKRLNAGGRYLPLRDVLHFTMDVCKAADYAHQRGLIHRDIKPANVMLDVTGNAILMDFGIARMLGGQQHTATGAVLGTALYMSPEQIQGLHPDARSDIYSIGVMLFEALGGRPPFEADSVMTLMMMHLNDPVPDLSKLNPDIPEGVKVIVNCALEKDRNNRFQSCSEMAAALEKAMASLGPQEAVPVSSVKVEPAPVPAAPSRENEKEQAAPPVPAMATIIEPAPLPATIIEPAGVIPAPIISDATRVAAAAAETKSAAASPLPISVPDVPRAKSSKTVLWAGLAALGLALIVGGYLIFNSINNGKQSPGGTAEVLPSATVPVVALLPTDTAAPTNTQPPPPTATAEPTATPTEVLPTPTDVPPASLVLGGADKIAYVVSNNIWIADIDGSDAQQITSDGATKKNLRWLPDGNSLSYISGKCIQTVALGGEPVTVTCFNNAEYVDAFEVSPDSKQVAISVDRLLYIEPYDLERLKSVDSHPDLEAMADCPDLAPYQRNAAVGARWSPDSKNMAVIAIGVLTGGRRGDMIQIIAVDRCIANPSVQLQFPQPHFTFSEYEHNATLTSFTWDGAGLSVLTGLTRKDGFGEMHIFNHESYKADLSINPVNGSCCYRDTQFSPDGKFLLFAFQDMTLGPNAVTRVYYIPFGTIGTGTKYDPLRMVEYTDLSELPQLTLRPAAIP